MNEGPILERYRVNAEQLGSRFLGLSPQDLYAPVAAFLPSRSAAILDIGAGSGRDAAWLARQGHRVVAVEPVVELARQAADLPGAEKVEWIADRLPDLAALRAWTGSFDLVLLTAVWHHLSDEQRATAFASVAPLMRRGAHLTMSLRHGPGEDGTLIFASDPGRTVAQAETVGLRLAHRVSAPSVQPGNVANSISWTWLVFQRPEEEMS